MSDDPEFDRACAASLAGRNPTGEEIDWRARAEDLESALATVEKLHDDVQEALAAARRECELLATRVDAAQRLLNGTNYLAWTLAGGEPECEHGYFLATPCRACDLALVLTGKARAALAAPAACVTPNGRTDSHGAYAERQPDGSWICTFCKQPVDGAAPAAGEDGT